MLLVLLCSFGCKFETVLLSGTSTQDLRHALATTQAHGYRTTRGRAGRFKQDWPTLPRQLFDFLPSDVQELCEDLIGEVGNPTWSKK